MLRDGARGIVPSLTVQLASDEMRRGDHLSGMAYEVSSVFYRYRSFQATLQRFEFEWACDGFAETDIRRGRKGNRGYEGKA